MRALTASRSSVSPRSGRSVDQRCALKARERGGVKAELAQGACGELRALEMTQQEIASACGAPRWTVRRQFADAVTCGLEGAC